MESISDLRERQRQAGAVFATKGAAEAGQPGSPLHFGDPWAEYAAALSGAVVFDWTDHAVVELSGQDRVAFLHNFCTNDIKRLSVGGGCEAFVTNVKGRIFGHVFVAADSSSLRIDAGPGDVSRLVAHLERYVINEDVTITDRSHEWGELLVFGPSAVGALSSLFKEKEVGRLEPLAFIDATFATGQVRVWRRDVGPHMAYVLSAVRAKLGEVWTALCQQGIRPAGGNVWSALRIEAGLPVYGVDLTEDNLAQEAGRTREAVSFTKGCYLGQEPIARIDAMGHVNRELRSLRVAGEAIPQAGARVFSNDTASTAVGTVTSAAFSFGSNSGVALALLRSNASSVGTQLFVETGASPSPATVFWLPAEHAT